MFSYNEFCAHGLKPCVLIGIFMVYQIVGAGIFYYCEHLHDEGTNRTLGDDKERTIQRIFNIIRENEHGDNNIDDKIKTLCTTIGYGHLYTTSTMGRILTMIYSLIGIPLVLSILDDLGKVITICLRKISSSSLNFAKRLYGFLLVQGKTHKPCLNDYDDKDCLYDFDSLSVRTTLLAIISWIGICAAVSCLWEDWSYFEAFYFFFISLSTIGLGDIMPTQPKYLLLMFVKIIIGFSLVSICISSIQHALEEFLLKLLPRPRLNDQISAFDLESLYRKKSSLGVIRGAGSTLSLSTLHTKYSVYYNNTRTKSTQTNFSIGSPLGNSWNKEWQRVNSFSRAPSFEDVAKFLSENERSERETEQTSLSTEDSNVFEVEDVSVVGEPMNLLKQQKICKCCLALAKGSIVMSRLLHENFANKNSYEKANHCTLTMSSLASLHRKVSRISLRERSKFKALEDQILLLN